MRASRSSVESSSAWALCSLLACACGRAEAPAAASAAVAKANTGAAQPLEAQAAATELDPTPAELAPAPAAECADLEREVAELKAELALAEERRVAREFEWQRYLETLRTFEIPSLPRDFEAEAPPEQGPPPPPEPAPDTTHERRSAEIARSLRTLLAIEGVRGIDLFEAGRLGDGWIGPVVFRELDERGRLAGSLCAARLRLEGSRAARTLTIVLEDGYESRSGARVQFPPEDSAQGVMSPIGVRRFTLPDVDPLPWVEALPELFGDARLDEPLDDGLWNASLVRAALNQLLRVDASHGYWRLKSLAGVTGGVLREVHLEGFDSAGALERRVFADRLTVVEQERGVLLLLEDGAVARGDERAPFLDARFRIYLPRAVHEHWRAAGLPGLSDPKPPRATSETPASD